MYMFVLIIHIVVSLVLIAVILFQAGRGGGLAETFGGGGGSQTTIFGQKASTFLTKATTVSAILFLCTSLTLAFISSRRQKSLMEDIKVIPSTQEQAEVSDTSDKVSDTSDKVSDTSDKVSDTSTETAAEDK